MSRVYFRDRRTALLVGYGLGLAAILVLRDAYEHRGKPRPFWSTFMPGG